MNLTIILAIAATLLLCIGLVRAGKKKTSIHRLVQALMNFAERNGSLISKHDNLDNLAIGLSERDGRLYFVKLVDGQQVFSEVLLPEIEKSTVTKTTRRTGSGGDEVIEKISIDFRYRDRSRPGVNFEFYNIEYDSLSVYGEYVLAQRWQTLLEEYLQPVHA